MTELEKRGEDPSEKQTVVPEDGGSVSFERVRLYLERHPDKQEFSKIDYDDGYVGEDWPRRGYALARKDIEQILDDADTAESERGEAQEAYNDLVQQKRQWVKDKDELDRMRKLVQSMRINGARHHFAFAYDRYVDEAGRRLQFCKECDKEREHPAHFFSSAKYLDSREVEKRAFEALKRVASVLESQGFKPVTAHNTALELLKGLPGVPEPEEGS